MVGIDAQYFRHQLVYSRIDAVGPPVRSRIH
jgi:hypothetical protein